MKITVTITKDIEPDCNECEYLKKSSQSLEHFGTPCTKWDYECVIDGLDGCPSAEKELDKLIDDKDFQGLGWEYCDHSVED